jgi:hypothetical protein
VFNFFLAAPGPHNNIAELDSDAGELSCAIPGAILRDARCYIAVPGVI